MSHTLEPRVITTNNTCMEYKGVFFDEKTPYAVAREVYKIIKEHKRIRLFFGDRETGEDWLVDYDNIGFIGVGSEYIPVFCLSPENCFTEALATENIVKIQSENRVIYEHPHYSLPEFLIESLQDGSWLVKTMDKKGHVTIHDSVGSRTQAYGLMEYYKGNTLRG